MTLRWCSARLVGSNYFQHGNRPECLIYMLQKSSVADFFSFFFLPWSGPSPRHPGRPGTCSCRTWRGHHLWSPFHSCERGAKRHTRPAVGQTKSLQRVFIKIVTFVVVFFCLLLNGIAFPCWRVPSQTGKHSPPKRPTTRFQRTKDMQPFQITFSKKLNNKYIHYRPLIFFTEAFRKLHEMISICVDN